MILTAVAFVATRVALKGLPVNKIKSPPYRNECEKRNFWNVFFSELFKDQQINLGVPSNLKLHSECNFRRLWGGRGWERVKAKVSPWFLKKKKGGGGEGSIESQQKTDLF